MNGLVSDAGTGQTTEPGRQGAQATESVGQVTEPAEQTAAQTAEQVAAPRSNAGAKQDPGQQNPGQQGSGRQDPRQQDPRQQDPRHGLLSVRDLVCGYGKKEVVHSVSLEVHAGEFACIIGANGCGKSTLLKNILGLDQPFSGEVFVNGQPTAHMSDAERARHFAYLPQEHTPPFPYTVADVVLMGRTPHLDRWSQVQDEDRDIAWDALCLLGIQHLAKRVYTELSGGQRQLVLIARCLAQQPELIVMDEPTASLDFGNQQVVLSRMRALTRDGLGVVMVTHDPHHAFLCSDRVFVMEEGRMTATGTPQEVMTAERLRSVYGTPVDVLDVRLTDGGEATVCVPLWEERA